MYENIRIGARVPLAGRLLFLLCALSLTSVARTIDIPVNIFGAGLSFDQIDLFDVTTGTKFDTNTEPSVDPDGAFAQWSFNFDTATYAVGTGPDTAGATLTLSLSGTTSSGLNDTVTIRVYLLSAGKIVAAFDVTFTDSGFIVVPVSTDLSTLQLAQQQAFTIAGTTPTGQQTLGGTYTGGGGTDPGGDPSSGGGGSTTPSNDNVPEPAPATLLAGAFVALAALRRVN